MEAFYDAHKGGRWVQPPDELVEMILVPATLHIDPVTFASYGRPVKERIKTMLRYHLAYGHGAIRPEMINKDGE